jgi:hypothetical protein
MKSNKYRGYQIVKHVGKTIRNRVSVLPTNKHDNILVSLVYKPLEFLVKGILKIGAFCLCGLFYEKGKDSPIKGSLLNTLFYILLALLLVKLFT